MSTNKNIYLAAPLFSQAEREFNLKLCDLMEDMGFSVFLPQEDAKDTMDTRHEDKQKLLFEMDKEAIDDCDILVGVLDGGSDVDSGTAWEMGYAYAKGKTLLGLKTDFRTLGSEGTVNLMVEVCLDVLVTDIDDLLNALQEYI